MGTGFIFSVAGLSIITTVCGMMAGDKKYLVDLAGAAMALIMIVSKIGVLMGDLATFVGHYF